MVPELSMVEAKLERAREHEGAFQACLDEYVQGDNFAVRSDYYADSGWNELRLEVHREPPNVRLALILGDALTNVRGALDYLVWQLVLKAGTHSPSRNTVFPVVRDASKWGGAVTGQLRGVAPQWVSLIADLQPYKSTDHDLHELAVLDDMNNYNKHRTIPASIHQCHTLTIPDLPVTPGMKYEFDNPSAPLRNGAVLFRVRREDRVQISFPPVNLVWRVGFDDKTGRQWDTRDVLAWVEGAIKRFEPAFANP